MTRHLDQRPIVRPDLPDPGIPLRMRVIDSHTEGEPTRTVIDGWPQPAGDTMAERAEDLASRQDGLRHATVAEPRGHAAVVGALLTEAVESDSDAGVIFFNNVGLLGMCGHGTMGVVETLRHLGRLSGSTARLDTSAGTVEAVLETDGRITVRNVPSRMLRSDVEITVPGIGRLRGDVAYGGNWFFLVEGTGGGASALPLPEADGVDRLTELCRMVLTALDEEGVRGEDGAPIDHVEICGPPSGPHADARNFVLCPGGEFDRSPCGTGTSAVMAVRHAKGLLQIGEPWRQEGIYGGVFEGWLEAGQAGALVPVIRGRAHVTAESTLLFESDDRFRGGIPG